MTSLLNASLPSEDEEDETFDPDAEAEAEKPKASAAKSKAPSRCAFLHVLPSTAVLLTCHTSARRSGRLPLQRMPQVSVHRNVQARFGCARATFRNTS